jgi:putative hydrolase of the HAD superfamily
MQPAAILFDLDETLADRAAAIEKYSRWFAADFENALHPCEPDEVHAAIVAADDFGTMRQAETLAASALWRTAPNPIALFEHWTARFGAAAVLFPDAKDLLEALRRRGVRMGVITNGGSKMQRSKIAALGIEAYFETIIVSSEVGLRKPDPAIFNLALGELQCAAAQCWFVGDDLEKDVQGSVAAGLRAFWFKSGSVEAESPAGTRLDSLVELLEHLNRSETGKGR